MNESTQSTIIQICATHGNDPTRMMDIVRDVQAALQCVSGEAMEAIAKACGTQGRAEITCLRHIQRDVQCGCQGRQPVVGF